MSKVTLYKKNDQQLVFPGLKNSVTQEPIVGMTIRVTLFDRAGTAVEHLTDLVMSDVVGVPGDYTVSISEVFDPPAGGGYKLVYTGTYSGIDFTAEQQAEVKVRKM